MGNRRATIDRNLYAIVIVWVKVNMILFKSLNTLIQQRSITLIKS